ncbi:amidase, partial [Pyrobaculum aerophilum]
MTMNVEKRIELAKRRADLNYFIYLNEKAVYEVDAVEKAGRCGALCGLAVAVKDNIEVAGMPITNGAPYMKKMADKTAPVVRRLIAEGAVVIGKTNMHELALGATNVNPHFGPTRNPHDPSRITGGSSGGSAGAVAIGVADLGIGTDTGGSVRIPAALCGVVGYKPPYGKIP